jgi:hypothetical protein
LIKKLLPPKAVARLRFLSPKTIGDYVDPDNQLKCWGGNNDYVFKFVPERRTIKDANHNNTNAVKKVKNRRKSFEKLPKFRLFQETYQLL